MKLTKIIDGLYTRGRFYDMERTAKLRDLEEAQIDVVVCLIRRGDPDLAPSVQAEYGAQIEYVHVPLSDGRSPGTIRTAVGLSKLVARRIDHGHGVLVHCNAGRNRAGLVAALTVAELNGVTWSEALDWVRWRRPGALGSNQYFQDVMREGRIL